jgi:hypothetical protein
MEMDEEVLSVYDTAIGFYRRCMDQPLLSAVFGSAMHETALHVFCVVVNRFLK